MADPIAKRLLAALAAAIQSQPVAAALSDSSSASSNSDNGSAAAAAAASGPTGTAAEREKKNIENLEKWSDELESQLLSGIQKFAKEDTTVTSETLKEAADTLHASILNEIAPSFVVKWEDDGAANKATLEAVESLSNENDLFNSESMDLYQLASLLRAAGVFMRWNAQVLQSPHAPINSPLEVAQNHMARLKFKSMLLLYAKLLAMEMPSTPTESYPDVPRFASICIFRATYGNDVMSATARRLFVNSIDGCSCLMKALLEGDQPVPRLFSVVRNVHHLVAACGSEAVPKMQKAIESLATEQNENNVDDETKNICGLSEALVATLAWAFRSEPLFPGGKKDRRPDLVLEILRALYALGSCKSHKPSHDTMTQIGIILCEMLQLSNADTRCYNIKLAVVALLLNAPKEYTNYLVENGSIKPLVDILSYQTSLVVIEKTGSSAEDAAAVVPILLVLLKLAQSNKSALQTVKDGVFPPEAEQAYSQKAQAEISKKQTEGKVNAKNMAPLDAPRGTLRWKLIRLMTWTTESNVKRAACELLWVLCGGDSTQFVLRTGFGNAIHFLGIRGCVGLPAGVDI